MEHLTIDGRICHILRRSDGPWLYWLAQAHCEDEMERLNRYIRHRVKTPYNLAAMEARDWNRDYSPWPAQLSDGSCFAGEGEKTRQCLEKLVSCTGDGQTRCLGGYSLAGLFSLWTLCSGAPFDGVACCSGSLWYPGWHEWRETHTPDENCAVYLSLGKKEEKTRHVHMSQVGDATRRQYEVLAGRHTTILKWNDGGHFTEPLQRMAEGFAWLLEVKNTSA